MAAPQGVSIAFSDGPLVEEPTWTRLDDPTGYRLAAAWTISRGRSSELDRTQSGTATVTLTDRDGTLDPTRTDGPFYGALNPMSQAAIAVQNPADNSWNTLYRGFVDEWQWDMDETGIVTVTLELVDAFALFADIEMMPDGTFGDYPGDSEGDILFEQTTDALEVSGRMIQALDQANWSGLATPDEGLRDLFTGNVQLQKTVYQRGDTLLTVLQDCADAEFPGVANLFIAKTGNVTFRGRFARFDPSAHGTVEWNAGTMDVVEGGDGTVAPISGLSWRRSSRDLINVATALPQNVAEGDVAGAVVSDSGSIDEFGWRPINFDNLLTRIGEPSEDAALVETTKFAAYYVDNYAEPQTRITLLRFRPRDPEAVGGPALWNLMCGVELSDIVNTYTTHRGGGGFGEGYFVEGVRYTANPMREALPGGWPDITLELDVSPASFFTADPFS